MTPWTLVRARLFRWNTPGDQASITACIASAPPYASSRR
jgi:hypothetical protein